MSTDRDWEEWGRRDPYFGVLTNKKYRRGNLTEEARAEFFRSGKAHVSRVIKVCRRYLDSGFSPKKVLDFGCGVGRLVVPFAEIAEHVVGLDVSESMLKEALANCVAHSVRNVTLLKSDDDLSRLEGRFDLIHSVIVFQHIPTDRGRHILGRLLSHLEDGGICAVHLTYAKAVFATTFGVRPAHPPGPEPVLRMIRREWRSRVRGPARNAGPPAETSAAVEYGDRDPEMQMNSYNLNEILFIIQSLGVRNMYVEMTDHGGELGVFVYFQKPAKA